MGYPVRGSKRQANWSSCKKGSKFVTLFPRMARTLRASTVVLQYATGADDRNWEFDHEVQGKK